mmetsp:Transcript_21242/g.3445  ORF Transcript_21242/g.3445 Transcript_21242/m.3445 type:complete len:127 (+) Transcript_21242:1-381(+)
MAVKASARNISSNFQNQSGHNSHIDWNDYNFPPLLKIIHFTLGDFYEPERGVIKKLFISWIILLAVCTWNILSTIVLVATIDPGIHVLFTILNWVLFVSFGTYVFYLGYYGIAKRENKKIFYYKIG